MPTFQQKLEKGVDETHLTGTPVVKVLIVVAHSSFGNDTNENKENDSEKNCNKKQIQDWLLSMPKKTQNSRNSDVTLTPQVGRWR